MDEIFVNSKKNENVNQLKDKRSDSVKKKHPLSYVVYFYAIATIQIVLVHARIMRGKNPLWISKMVDFVDDYHMVLFFFIAGVLLSYTAPRHDSIWGWYKGKLVKLVCPFFLLTIAAFLPKVYLDPILHNGVNITLSYILHVFFYPRKTIWGHFWFIPVYLTIMPIVYLLAKKIRSNKIVWAGILIASAFLNYFPADVGWFGIRDICRFLFYALVGVTIEPEINKEKTKKMLGNCTMVIVVIVLAMTTYYFRQLKIVMKIHILLMVLLVLCVSMVLERYRIKALEEVGNNNMAIYIYSWPVQAVIEIACIQIFKLNVNVVFIIKAILGLMIPLFIKWGVSKFKNFDKVGKYIGL